MTTQLRQITNGILFKRSGTFLKCSVDNKLSSWYLVMGDVSFPWKTPTVEKYECLLTVTQDMCK